jgi:hypothetical protein
LRPFPGLPARLSRQVGGVPRAPGSLPGARNGFGWSAGRKGLQAGDCGGDFRGPGLSCSGLVTTPAEVVEEGSGLGGYAGLGGHLLGADGDSG